MEDPASTKSGGGSHLVQASKQMVGGKAVYTVRLTGTLDAFAANDHSYSGGAGGYAKLNAGVKHDDDNRSVTAFPTGHRPTYRKEGFVTDQNGNQILDTYGYPIAKAVLNTSVDNSLRVDIGVPAQNYVYDTVNLTGFAPPPDTSDSTGTTKAKLMHNRYLVMVALLGWTAVGAFAQSTQSPATSSPSSAPKWMTEKWTGSRKLYQQAENKIKMDTRLRTDPLLLVAQYKANALQHPIDSISVFRWAFAVYYLSSTTSLFKTPAEITQARQIIAQTPSPKVYEFTRLRFALAASAGGYIYPLKPVGERLLQSNPKDDVVKFWLIQVLDDGLSDADKQKALTYSRQLIQSSPQKPYGYNLLGWTYLVIFMKSHQSADGNKAILAYRQSLRLTTANNPTRSSQEHLIDLIKTMQKNRR